MKVLIVDDEPLVRLSLKRALVKAGHEVLEAEDGQHGMDLWQKYLPDLIYLDVLMPRMSGPDLLKVMRLQHQTSGKVILMSAFMGQYDLAKAQSLGADLFVLKPFENIFSIVNLGEELVSGRPVASPN